MRQVVGLAIDPSNRGYTSFLKRCAPFIFRGVRSVSLSGERCVLGIMDDVGLLRAVRVLPLGLDVQINSFDRQGSADAGAKGR